MVAAMKALTLHAPAKVNLHLRIRGRRTDGLHEIETLFQKIDLGDTLSLAEAESDALEIARSPWELGPLEENLVWRALQALRRHVAFPPVRLRLTKGIPPGAGLGGGSSDGAAALRGIVRLFGLRVAEGTLAAIARALGADVPFLLSPAPCAIGRGIGDEIEPVSHRCGWRLVLVYPGHPSPTADAYRLWQSVPLPGDSPSLAALVAALRSGDADAAAAAIHSDFAPSLFSRYPSMARAAQTLRVLGCSAVWPTGSGSTVVGLCPAGWSGMEALAASLPESHWTAWAAMCGDDESSPQTAGNKEKPRGAGPGA